MRVTTSITSHALNKAGDESQPLERAGFNSGEPPRPIPAPCGCCRRYGDPAAAYQHCVAFSRSQMPVANAAWDLQHASGGRFTLGLGSQVKGHNVRRFSVPRSAPAPRMREYVEALRAIFRCWETGERLAYNGAHYQF